MSKIIRLILTLLGAILISQCMGLILLGKINFGSLVPFLIGLVFIVHGLFWHKLKVIVFKKRWLKRLWFGLWGGFGVWAISFVVFIVALNMQISQTKTEAPQVAAIIVLGSGTVDGKPTKTLAKRLDASAPLIKNQPNAIAITSGGVGLGRSRSEAEIMANYLRNTHAIPISRIIQEGRSTSTEKNLINSKAILATKGINVSEPNQAVAIVTSDFHTIRAKAIAKRYGYANPVTIPSNTPLIIRYNAWFREYFAFVSGWLLNEY